METNKSKAQKMALKSFIKENASLLKDKKKQLILVQKDFTKEESVTAYSKLILLQAQIHSLQEQTRYLYITYGEIRGKERKKIETCEKAIDENTLKKLLRRFSKKEIE